MIELPLRDGNTVKITDFEKQQYAEAYPGVNVDLQFRRMKIWLAANPQKRPLKYMNRFIQQWLNRNKPRKGEPWSAAWSEPEKKAEPQYSCDAEVGQRHLDEAKRILRGGHVH